MTKTVWLCVATLLTVTLGALAVAGGAQGVDLLGLFVVLPVTLWVLARPVSGATRLILTGSHARWLCLGAGLALAQIGIGDTGTARFLPAFLIGCGALTGLAWTLLLWLEMATGAYPPATCSTIIRTYAIDLGVIAPACIAAAVARRRGLRPRGSRAVRRVPAGLREL